MAEKIEIFFCYAEEDESFRLKLENQLSGLEQQGIITLWHKRIMSGGTNREAEIVRHLNSAHMFLLLISPDFMASISYRGYEVEHAMERYAHGDARIMPIILRPVDWQGASFGNLQALPGNAVPITAWRNPDEAFLNIVRGIKQTIGELLACRQPRNIALFHYETQGNHTTPFSLDGAYEAWLSTKKDFSSNEIIGQTWIKTSNPEHTFIIHFLSGGTFREYSLSDPGNQWQGSWEVLCGTLRLRVNTYELDILSNRESQVYSGIEFAKDTNEVHSYFALFPFSNNHHKHWDINSVPELIEQIFEQILHQKADIKILITYGALLCRGEISVQNIVKILGFSRRYKERIIQLRKTEEVMEHLYITFLGRKTAQSEHRFHTQKLKLNGSNIFIADLIDSEEYERRFGEDTFPSNKRPF